MVTLSLLGVVEFDPHPLIPLTPPSHMVAMCKMFYTPQHQVEVLLGPGAATGLILIGPLWRPYQGQGQEL